LPHRTMRLIGIAVLPLVLSLLIGCSGPSRAEMLSTPTVAATPTAFVPTVTATVTPTQTLPTPTVTATVSACGASPCRAATPTVAVDPAFAALVDPEPGEATLSYGADVQKGIHGYAVWCTASGQMAIYDTFGRVMIPTAALSVPQGSAATFTYLGADPLREILARLYTAAATTGAPLPPGQFTIPKESTGTDLPVVQAGRVGTMTLTAPPGEYILFVNARLQSGDKAGGCSAQYQFRLRLT
jgi:hypothetical protein